MDAVMQPKKSDSAYALQILLASFFTVRSAIRLGQAAAATAKSAPTFDAAPSPPTAEDLRWAKKLDSVTFDALDNTRAAAAKWAQTIAAVTGVFGTFALIKGRSDITALTQGWEITVAVILLVATLLALRSIMLAALAAEGSPTSEAVDASNVRQYFSDANIKAQWQLLASRVTAVLATLGAGVAVGMVWFAPQSAPKPPLDVVRLANGYAVCGAVSVNSNGTLKVTATDGKTVVRASLRSSAVKSIARVTACP
jgi:hypothetical protein